MIAIKDVAARDEATGTAGWDLIGNEGGARAVEVVSEGGSEPLLLKTVRKRPAYPEEQVSTLADFPRASGNDP
jgi:hypothetical protein